MNKLLKYCYTCGAELHWTEHIWSYNELTGKPNVTYIYRCSTKPWFFLPHPATESDAYVFSY